MNKKLLIFGLPILALALVSGALLVYYGQITQEFNVSSAILVNGVEEYTNSNVYSLTNGWEQKYTSEAYVITNDANRDLSVNVITLCEATIGGNDCVGITTSYDTIGLSTRFSSVVDAFADASLTESVVTLTAEKYRAEGDWSSSEARITIDASDVKVKTLDDLVNMSWDVNVLSGYIAHVDVIIDKDGNGVADDALVFEAAKVDPINCELAIPYPTGIKDTLGRVSIIDGTSYAWLNSGAPGPGCITGVTSPAGIFYTNTLSGWKDSYQEIDGDTIVLRFEIEVDPWIADSESEISNIVINGVPKELKTQTSPMTLNNSTGREVFYVNNIFDKLVSADTYTITTSVNPVA